MENNKMIKLARILEKVFTVFFWILIAGTVLAGIFGVYILSNPQKIETSLVLGPVSLTLQDGLFHSTSYVEMISILLYLFLMLPMLLAFLWTLKAIFRPISMGLPFEEMGKLIRRLAWLELAGGFLSMLFTWFSQCWMFQAYEIDQLLLNDKIQAVTYIPDGNLNFLLYFAVLFLLSWVFDYGKSLQQLSDETL